MTIPFASTLADGQYIALHYLRADENEYVELIDIKGAASTTLSGALLEWEFQAKALTRCEQPFFCLVIAPDEAQGRYTNDMLYDYIARAEEKNDLTDQPRAIVRHIKNGEEHFHVVWSRVDRENCVAKEVKFYKERLMTVTREFARDHGLILPDGYRRHEERQRKKNRDNQLSRADCITEKKTGITKKERMAAISKLWKGRDDARSFVNGLNELGYELCVGRNGRRPVVVDIYGTPFSLRDLIDDRAVKQKHVFEFLGPDYAPNKLQTVAAAQAQARQHRKAVEDFEKARAQSDKVTALRQRQARRRASIENRLSTIKATHAIELDRLRHWHTQERTGLDTKHNAVRQRIIDDREARKPTGLAAFLGRVTGVNLLVTKIQRHRDRQREQHFQHETARLQARQAQDEHSFRRTQSLKRADLDREHRRLPDLEATELQSLLTAMTGDQRRRFNSRYEHMPTFTMELKPRGRKAVPHKAMTRHTSKVARELAKARSETIPVKRPVKLGEDFARAAGSAKEDKTRRGDAGDAQAARATEPVSNTAEQGALRPDQIDAQSTPAEETALPTAGQLAKKFSDIAAEKPDDSDSGDTGETGSGGKSPAPDSQESQERQRQTRRARRKAKRKEREQRADDENEQERQNRRQRRRRRRRDRDLDRGM